MDLQVQSDEAKIGFDDASTNLIALTKDNKKVSFTAKPAGLGKFDIQIALTHDEIKAAYELSSTVQGMVM